MRYSDKPAKQKFRRYPIGFFHIDIVEVRTAEGKLYVFVGIDRTSKFAFVQRVNSCQHRYRLGLSSTAWWRPSPMTSVSCENVGDKLVHGSGAISQPRAE